MTDELMRLDDFADREAVKGIKFSSSAKAKQSGGKKILSVITSIFGSKKSKAIPESYVAKGGISQAMDI